MGVICIQSWDEGVCMYVCIKTVKTETTALIILILFIKNKPHDNGQEMPQS